MKKNILRRGLGVLMALGVMSFMLFGHLVNAQALTPNQQAVCDSIGRRQCLCRNR